MTCASCPQARRSCYCSRARREIGAPHLQKNTQKRGFRRWWYGHERVVISKSHTAHTMEYESVAGIFIGVKGHMERHMSTPFPQLPFVTSERPFRCVWRKAALCGGHPLAFFRTHSAFSRPSRFPALSFIFLYNAAQLSIVMRPHLARVLYFLLRIICASDFSEPLYLVLLV